LSDVSKVKAILDASADWLPGSARKVAIAFIALGVLGIGLGFGASGDPGAGWAALITPIVMVMGIAMVGPLISAIFQMTGAKWGRAYRRIAEGSVALMPLGLAGLLVLMAGGNAYLPWVREHPHLGGKAVWLTRGFWDARVIGGLLVAYAVGLAFVRLSLKRDFCNEAVSDKFDGFFAKHLKKGITDAETEAARIERRLAQLAPLVAVVYGVIFSFLGFDLIMSLEPGWFSTLYGAWYLIGNLFAGFALIAVLSVAVSMRPGMDRFLSQARQSDMATLLLAFCLINADFFWNQYLTIWYANIPEETFYLIERTVDEAGPWRSLSFVSLATFFVIPFVALLLRKVKQSRILLTGVGVVAIIGVLMARFIEIAPSVLASGDGGGAVMPLVSAGLVFLGFVGGGLLLYLKMFSGLPILAVNEEILLKEMARAVEDE
jgi:hypothetical protein